MKTIRKRSLIPDFFINLWQLLLPESYCPVCCRRVGKFHPLPKHYSENASRHGYAHFGRGETINVDEYSCPHCGASDRERLYALFIDAQTACESREESPFLLHFAPEGALSSYIRRRGQYRYRTADLGALITDDKVDITNMDAYPDGFCDAFICSHVLEHVADDHAALNELHRILKPGGWGILMVPVMTHLENSVEDSTATTEAERWRLFGQGDHVRLYAKTDFLRRVANAGFSIRQLGAGYFGADTFQRCGITSKSVLYVVSHD